MLAFRIPDRDQLPVPLLGIVAVVAVVVALAQVVCRCFHLHHFEHSQVAEESSDQASSIHLLVQLHEQLRPEPRFRAPFRY